MIPSLLKYAKLVLDIKKGDIVLTGRFKNKRTVVKDMAYDELGQPTINGKKLLDLRIEKLLPFEKRSRITKDLSKKTAGSVSAADNILKSIVPSLIKGENRLLTSLSQYKDGLRQLRHFIPESNILARNSAENARTKLRNELLRRASIQLGAVGAAGIGGGVAYNSIAEKLAMSRKDLIKNAGLKDRLFASPSWYRTALKEINNLKSMPKAGTEKGLISDITNLIAGGGGTFQHRYDKGLIDAAQKELMMTAATQLAGAGVVVGGAYGAYKMAASTSDVSGADPKTIAKLNKTKELKDEVAKDTTYTYTPLPIAKLAASMPGTTELLKTMAREAKHKVTRGNIAAITESMKSIPRIASEELVAGKSAMDKWTALLRMEQHLKHTSPRSSLLPGLEQARSKPYIDMYQARKWLGV